MRATAKAVWRRSAAINGGDFILGGGGAAGILRLRRFRTLIISI
ncbi:hypothetical protein BLAT2472_40462 [Burkholderia latens]